MANHFRPKEGFKSPRMVFAKSPYLSTAAEFGAEFEVQNATGTTLAIDKLVCFSGYDTDSTDLEPTVQLAKADAQATLATHITTEAISNGDDGFVAQTAMLVNVNTNAGTVGDPVYLSAASAGAWTLTKPTGTNYVQVIGRIVKKSATAGVIYINLAESQADTLYELIANMQTSQGYVSIPMTTIREVSSNNLPDSSVAVVDSVTTQGAAGILAPDTTPALEFANGDTDSCLRIVWTASDSTPIVAQAVLPPDINVAAPITVRMRAAVESAVDTPTLAFDTFFNEGDTKVEDTSTAIVNTVGSYQEVVTTIAAADIPTGAQTITMEVTPGAHTGDALYMSAMWIEYTKTILTS